MAYDLELEKKITEIARDRCDSEYKEGKDYKKEILANGDLSISLLGRKKAGLEGKFIYKQGEWKGRPFVQSSDQAKADEEYRACVLEQSKELMKRYQPKKEITRKPSCGEYHEFAKAKGDYTVFCSNYSQGERGFYYKRSNYLHPYPSFSFGPDTGKGFLTCNLDNLNKKAQAVYFEPNHSMSNVRVSYNFEKDGKRQTSGIYEVVCKQQPEWKS